MSRHDFSSLSVSLRADELSKIARMSPSAWQPEANETTPNPTFGLRFIAAPFMAVASSISITILHHPDDGLVTHHHDGVISECYSGPTTAPMTTKCLSPIGCHRKMRGRLAPGVLVD
jgi:hypothetical protein